MSGCGQYDAAQEERNYIDDCLDQIRRIAVGRPCPDRDYCRQRLLDILEAILIRRSRFEDPDADKF